MLGNKDAFNLNDVNVLAPWSLSNSLCDKKQVRY